MVNNPCYCDDLPSLGQQLCKSELYQSENRRLFLDSGKDSLKAVILHNGNRLPFVSIAHATKTAENYETMKILLAAEEYKKQQWKICGDLRVIGVLLDLKSGYTNHMCFLCLWNSRADAEHYVRKEWLTRPRDAHRRFNSAHSPFVDPENIVLPPLHLKLGLDKKLIKAMDQSCAGFVYSSQKLIGVVSEVKLKAGDLNRLNIYILVTDREYTKVLNSHEKNAWESISQRTFLETNVVPTTKKSLEPCSTIIIY